MLEVGRVPLLSQADLDTMWNRYTAAIGEEAANAGNAKSKIRDLQDYMVELSGELEAKE